MFAFFDKIFYNSCMTDKKRQMNDKLDAVFAFIKTFSAQNGFPPSVREICKELDISSTATAYYYIQKLEKRGDILKAPQKNRALNIKNEQSFIDGDNCVSVPLVGRVHAGLLTEAIENNEDNFVFSKNLFGGSDLFMLKVVGESMINAGIDDGDLVVVKKQNNANNGDIVVALVENEATVKRFFRKKDCCVLHPENENFRDIIVKDLKIMGVVNGLIRKI